MTAFERVMANATSGLGKTPQEDQQVFTQAQWSQVIFVRNLSRWQVEGIKRLTEVFSLQNNWDSYGSPAPTQVATEAAIELLMNIDLDYFLPPRVVPVSGGGLQFEWDFGTRELEFEILHDGSIEYLKTQRGDPVDEGQVEPTDLARARSLCSWLISVGPGTEAA